MFFEFNITTIKGNSSDFPEGIRIGRDLAPRSSDTPQQAFEPISRTSAVDLF